MASTLTEQLGDVPNEFASPPRAEMKHTLTLNIPLPDRTSAAQLYHVLRIDKELKPRETFIAYRLVDERATTLDIRVHCCTVRQLRLSVNALMDSISLVLATMEAFAPAQKKNASAVDAMPDGEFELNGTGRAG